VDSVPEGFKVVTLEYGSNFYCSSCDSPVNLLFHWRPWRWPSQPSGLVPVLQSAGFKASMSRKGDCYDNPPMESFFHTLNGGETYSAAICRGAGGGLTRSAASCA
jgi:hypothetical protein